MKHRDLRKLGMSAALAALAALALACGPKKGEAQRPGAGAPSPSAIPGVPTVVGGGLPPALLAAVGDKKLFIESFDSLLLFEDERLIAQRILAQWASASGLTIIPPEDSERAFSRAAAGAHALTGAPCGPPLPRWRAKDRWRTALGAAGSITARVSCDGDCVLQLSIELTEQGTEFYAAPFDPGAPWREELVRRLPTVVDNGGHGQHGHGNNPIAIQGAPPGRAAAEWLSTDDNMLQLTPEQQTAIANSCDLQDAVELRVGPGEAGAPGPRCEAVNGSFLAPPPAVAACVCAAATAGLAVRARRHVAIAGRTPPSDPRRSTANGLDIYAEVFASPSTDVSYAHWYLPESATFRHCFTARAAPFEHTRMNVTIDFDDQGVATKASIGDLNGVLEPAERACVTEGLLTSRAACPGTATISGIGSMLFSITKP
ncbi:MAG: hypothetical protein R3B48_15480 [Kofleriaceae bacterium]